MWTLNIKTISMAVLTTIALSFGVIELYLMFTDISTNWTWLLLSLFYSALIYDMFNHLIIAHRYIEYDTNRWFYKLLVFLGTVGPNSGPLINFGMMHDVHHRYADQDEYDPVSVKLHWYTTLAITPLMYVYLPKQSEIPGIQDWIKKQQQRQHNLVTDPWTNFCDNNAILLCVVTWTVLFFLAPVLLFKVIFVSRVMASVWSGVLQYVGHTPFWFNYRNFNTNNTSQNNIFLYYLGLGLYPSVLHNNHHGDFSKKYRWFERGPERLFLNYLLPLLLAKRKSRK